MHIENIHATLEVRAIDENLAIEPTRTQQSGIKNLRAIGRRQNDHPCGWIKAVHLSKKLVQSLLFLIVASQSVSTSRPAQSIQLVDENDCWSTRARVLKKFANPRGTDSNEHLHELRPIGGEKRDASLTGERASEQRLARAGRTHQQNTLRNAGAESAVSPRVLQEINYLLQLLLGLIHAGNIRE